VVVNKYEFLGSRLCIKQYVLLTTAKFLIGIIAVASVLITIQCHS